MHRMEQKILDEGKVLPGGILKVGDFLNQKIDTEFLREIGEEIARLYEGEKITKILTIESSGIALAVSAGFILGVPVVFAKKHKSSNVEGDVYSASIHSYTHNEDYDAVVASEYLESADRVLLVDDFLANGNALKGLREIAEKAGAEVVGAAIAIEKKFQGGGDELRKSGLRVESLAMIASMSDDSIEFYREEA